MTEMGKSGKKWGEVGQGGVKILKRLTKLRQLYPIVKLFFQHP